MYQSKGVEAMKDLPEVSPRDYHTTLKLDRSDLFSSDSWLSKSALWELKTASLFRWREHPKEFTPNAATDFGNLVDCLVTTPDEFDQIIAPHDFPNFKTNEAQEFRDESRGAGLIPVNPEQMKQGRIAANRILSHPEAGPIVQDSAKQVVLLNELLGFRFKGLVDIVPDAHCLYDIKTTGKLTKKAIEDRVAEMGYHVQAAIYLKLWNLCYPDDKRKRFRLIWQENQPPYEVAVTELTAPDIEAGKDWAAYQINRLKKAAQNDCWPPIFDGKVVMISRPTYALFQDEEEMDDLIKAPSLEAQEDAA